MKKRLTMRGTAENALLLAALLMGIALAALIAGYNWDRASNRDFEFGYYATFNRIKHALQKMPDVRIAREWANRDVTLEEFGFDMAVNAGRHTSFTFRETDPVRDLSGDALTRALESKIRVALVTPIMRE